MRAYQRRLSRQWQQRTWHASKNKPLLSQYRFVVE
jgi:hypothetical protein